MAIQINFKKCISEKNAVNKVYSGSGLSLSGVLKDDTSIIDPVITIQYVVNSFSDFNYCEIPTLKRKYFITDIISLSNSFIEVHCHVDVLSSFKDSLLTNSAIIKSAEQGGVYNLYLNDGSLVQYQNPRVITREFPRGFGDHHFVLAVSGR